jgi:galactokinase
MQQVPLYHVQFLRDATLQDVNTAKDKMEETTYRRAKHVVTENQRVKECKIALKTGLWDHVGKLMNASHVSLKEDFEVSCEELDVLVDIAQAHLPVMLLRISIIYVHMEQVARFPAYFIAS